MPPNNAQSLINMKFLHQFPNFACKYIIKSNSSSMADSSMLNNCAKH